MGGTRFKKEIFTRSHLVYGLSTIAAVCERVVQRQQARSRRVGQADWAPVSDQSTDGVVHPPLCTDGSVVYAVMYVQKPADDTIRFILGSWLGSTGWF